MCTSERPRSPLAGPRLTGFSLVELLVGLALASLLIAATAPLWVSLQRAGVEETDRTVFLLQQRVAAARLERDLRLAGARGCLFTTAGPVLEASASQIVLLVGSSADGPPILVEWEITRGALMRRWGPCPGCRPAEFTHSLYRDNKTVLEGLSGDSAFTYVVDGVAVDGPVTGGELAAVQAAVLSMCVGGGGAGTTGEIATMGWIGR